MSKGRFFAVLPLVAAIFLLTAACGGPTSTPVIIEKEVIVEVIKEVVVVKEVIKEVLVEKIVIKEVIREVEVIRIVLATPTPAPTPTSPPAQTATPLPTKEPIAVPEYVVPIRVVDDSGQVLYWANAGFVDEENRRFVANAHVVQRGEMFEVSFNDAWYPVVACRINWYADIAILQLTDDTETLRLPESVSFGEVPSVGDNVYLRGYVFEQGAGGESPVSHLVGVVVPVPYSLDVVVIRTEFDLPLMDDTATLFGERAVYSDQLFRSSIYDLLRRDSIDEEPMPKLPDKWKSRYYPFYIVMKPLSSGQTTSFQEGMSGTFITTKEGDAVAILSTLGGAIPVEEIKKLLEKVTVC